MGSNSRLGSHRRSGASFRSDDDRRARAWGVFDASEFGDRQRARGVRVDPGELRVG